MGKALKTVGVIIGAAALIATGVGALAMPALAGTTTLFGVSVGTLNTISSGLVAVGGMLDKPKSQGSAAPDEWTSNPDQPIPFLMGRMGVAGKIVQRDEFGPDNMYQGIVGILSGAGPIRAVTSFAGDKQPVTFGANGIAVTSQWEGEMWMVRRSGAQPDTVLTVPAGLKTGGTAFEWSSAAKLSGKACYLQVLGENSKGTAFPAGIPDPVHVAEGIFGYDPRYDDTYPGGEGSCRLGVRSTYRWIEDGGIGGLNWALGLVENGQVVGGIGASIDGIDVPAFVEVANIADANGWKLAAWPDTSEDVSAVLDQLLQAAGAVRARHAGKISCVSRGAPRASVATITARDTAGDIELDTAPSLFNRLNTITPRFMSEAAGWVLTPANPVAFAQYVTDDGGKHGDQIDYRFVPLLKQAAELAAYDILDAREPFSGTIPLKAHMRHLKRGDTFDIDEPGFLMDGVKCIVLSRSYDPKTAQVRIGFRSETDSKHALALGKTTTLPDFPTLTPTDPTIVSPPLPDDWVTVVRPPAPGGTQLPGFDLTGVVSNATATAIIVEHGPTETGPWTTAYQGPPTVTTIPIDGLQSGETYFIAIQYQRNQNYSDRAVYGPYTAPTLTAGVSDETLDQIVDDVLGQVGDIAAGTEAAEELAEVVLETILNEQANIEAEAKQRVEDLRNEALERGENIAEVREEVSAVAGDLSAEVITRTQQIAATQNAVAVAEQSAKTYADGKYAQVEVNFTTTAAFNSGLATTLSSSKSYTDAFKTEAAQTYSTIASLNSGLASTFQQAKSYTDAFKSEASILYATNAVLASTNAATLSSAQSYADGKVATALNGVYTKAQTDSGLSTTLQQAKSYSDDKETAATLLFATKAERANGDAATYQSAVSYVDAYKSEAALTFATISNLGGVSATAALALSSAVDAQTQLGEASFSVVAAAGGDPAVIYAKAKGSTSVAGMIASVLRFANTVGGATVEAMRLVAGEVFFMRPIYIDVGSKRLIVGPGSDWVMWFGPNTITAASATRINGHWAFGSDGKVYYGSSELTTGGGGFHAQANAAIRVGTRTSPGLVTTSTLRITVSGATGPVTWESAVMGGADDWVVTNASGTVSGSYFDTAFRASVSTPGEQKRGQFAFLVTDTGSGKSFTIPAAGAAIYNV